MKLNFASGKLEFSSFFKLIKFEISLIETERFIEQFLFELFEEINDPKSTLSTLFLRISINGAVCEESKDSTVTLNKLFDMVLSLLIFRK